jgi:hypothetical protein
MLTPPVNLQSGLTTETWIPSGIQAGDARKRTRGGKLKDFVLETIRPPVRIQFATPMAAIM